MNSRKILKIENKLLQRELTLKITKIISYLLISSISILFLFSIALLFIDSNTKSIFLVFYNYTSEILITTFILLIIGNEAHLQINHIKSIKYYRSKEKRDI
jgi:magnesium-transporting ATPase (P-type)